MSIELVPDPIIFVCQGVSFVASLWSANRFLIQPYLRLHNERRKRTKGALIGAQGMIEKSQAIETSYNLQLSAVLSEAKQLKNAEIMSGQAEAEAILLQSRQDAELMLQKSLHNVEQQVSEERIKLPSLSKKLAEQILANIQSVATLAVFFLSAFHQKSSLAASGNSPVDPWYGIFWPTFQFFVFLAGVAFFGKKIVSSILQKNRENLRAKLSESQQALADANARVKEYEEKLSRLKVELDSIRETYQSEGNNERNRIVKEAKDAANQIMKEAQLAGLGIVKRAQESLRAELVSQAVEAVEASLTKGSSSATFGLSSKKLILDALSSSNQPKGV
jgi:F0F1-type ATP synthase membrane subunit b/b'